MVTKYQGEWVEANEEMVPKMLYPSEICKNLLEPQSGEAECFDAPANQSKCKF